MNKASIRARLVKDKTSKVYHAKFRDREGKTHTLTTKETNLERATEVLERSKLLELEAAARAGLLTDEALTVIMSGRKVTCEAGVADWATWRASQTDAVATVYNQELVLRQLLARLGAEKWAVTRLEYDHLDRFVNPTNEDCTMSTRYSRIAALRSWFDYLTARSYYVGHPARLLKLKQSILSHEQMEPKVVQPFTDKEVKLILKYTREKKAESAAFLYYATAFSYWAGLRLGDVAGLEWASITDSEIVVWTKKGGTRVALPLDHKLIGGGFLRTVIMEIMSESTDKKYVFPKEREINRSEKHRSRHSLYFSRILGDLEIVGKSFHGLRHSFATRLDAAGKSIEEIGRALGHSKSSTAGNVTSGYIHR